MTQCRAFRAKAIDQQARMAGASGNGPLAQYRVGLLVGIIYTAMDHANGFSILPRPLRFQCL